MAVWAALTAAPGATAARIAAAAGTSRIVAGQELAALETSGLATRTPGARNGRTTAPATWQPAPQTASPAPAPTGAEETEPAGTADPPAESPAPADGDASIPAPGSGPPPDEADASTPGPAAAESTVTGTPGADETTPAQADDGAPGANAAPDAGIPDGPAADGPAAGGNAAPAPADSEPQPAPADGAAPAGEAAVLLREVASAAAQAAEVLDGGDTAAALATVDTICAIAAQSRRLLKAAASGRKPRGTTSPAARPGQLRDLVAAHLAGHPDADFTPHAICRVLGRSSGAVANALDRLTALGQAQLTSDKPRRYRYQATAATPAPAPAGTT